MTASNLKTFICLISSIPICHKN